MKVVKRVMEYLIAIAVIPAIVLTVVHVTELKDVINVQYELLSEEDGIYNVTPGTYDRLVKNKKFKNYELESNYPLITQEEMDRATLELGDLKNEIYIDENGEKRIRLEVERITFDGSENWRNRMSDVTDDGVHVIYSLNVNLNVTPVSADASINFTQDLFENSGTVGGYQYAYENGEGVYMFYGGDIIYITIKKERLNGRTINEYLSQNPLTITYELAVKNPNSRVIEGRDITVTPDYVRLVRPNDFSGNPDGLLITGMLDSSTGIFLIKKYEVTENWIYVYPRVITAEELASRMVGKTLYYELSHPRPVEVYDFSKFRLTYDKNRIRVVFDIDDEYYLWEITQDDKMIPINGQYDLGNIWTVKFYVYEIQQPLIRNLVLLIPLIVVSGLLLYMMKKKDLSL